MEHHSNINPKDHQSGEIIGGGKLIELQQKVVNEGLLNEAHWMTRIFPSKTDFEKGKYQAEIFKLKAEAEYDLIKMHREAMRQSFKEALDTMLMNGKVKTRKDRIEFFTHHAKELEKTMINALDEFIQVTNARYERLKTLKHELQIELEGEAIKLSINHFYKSIATMQEDFHRIVEEGV